ncbi:glycosyltransferase family 2 protein [Pontibacter lucknowensis]|uniref:Glycosyltransferase involved in cell wall bisynthesis n=1 Tax=Pontibacter lucknowensis TaxID=1077936 RepID=A0A1N6Y779_9BACT|nr:glycosyltransferase family 2 protein [Pontibacter lucknowensis]SIR10417.1 Glycosyltransferase involved in cell wall bisynthesis [Pontibacter lucknowensis]
MSLVSIIIPVYNRIDLLEETLTSIESQTYLQWECILVDDHSTDGSFEFLENYTQNDKRYKLYKRPKDLVKGAPSCRNFGFSKSSGQYIQWFDSDDIMHPEMLEKKVSALTKYNYDFVICLLNEFEGNEYREVRYKTHSNTPALSYIKAGIYFFTPGPLFNRIFLESKLNQLFNLKLKKHQEWEFYFRVLVNSTNYATINDVLIHRRIHENSLAKTIKVEKKADYYLHSRICAIKYLISKKIKISNSYAYLIRDAKSNIIKSFKSSNFNALNLSLIYLSLINFNYITSRKKII